MRLCDLSHSAGIHPTTKAIKPVDLALVQAIDQGGNLGGEHPTKLQALRQNNQGRSEAMASEMCGLPSAIADLLGERVVHRYALHCTAPISEPMGTHQNHGLVDGLASGPTRKQRSDVDIHDVRERIERERYRPARRPSPRSP